MPEPKRIYLFLDESGDFNFSPSGTKFYTISAVTKSRPFSWDEPLASLRYDLIDSGLDVEYFHASEDRQIVRDKVFPIIFSHLEGQCIDSIIVEKRKTGPALQPAESFYPRMIGYLIRYILDSIHVKNYDEVIVVTDKIPLESKRRAIEKAIKRTLTDMLPAKAKYKVLHHSSKSSVGLQVADYCNWAIYRRWEVQDIRSYRLITKAVRSEFDIFASGTRHYY